VNTLPQISSTEAGCHQPRTRSHTAWQLHTRLPGVALPGVVLLSLSLLGIGGCSGRTDSAAPVATGSRPHQPLTARDQRGNGRTPAKPSPLTKALNVWVKALTEKVRQPQPPKLAQAGAGKPRPVTLGRFSGARTASRRASQAEITTMAVRHPAWRLADALARSRASSISLAPLRMTRIPGAADLPDAADRAPLRPLGLAGAAAAGGFSQAGERVPATGVARLQADAKQRQESAISQFLQEVEARQNEALSEQEADMRAGLEEDIRAARRITLARLVPVLPAAEEQLEMTNLRLDLIPNLGSTAQEREWALQYLRYLEAEWRALLSIQEFDRRMQLERLRDEVPRRLRREGEATIAQESKEAGLRYTRARAKSLESQRIRMEQDFDRRWLRLGINLPPAAMPSQRLTAQGLILDDSTASYKAPTLPDSATAGASGQQIITTRGPGTTSVVLSKVVPGSAGSAVSSRLATPLDRHILSLRALARNDAQRWAEVAARRAAQQRTVGQ